MKKPRHTPGEWVADGNGVHVYKGSVGECVAIAYAPHPEDKAEVHANAHLIAASPDLYAELKRLEWSGGLEHDPFDRCPRCGGLNPKPLGDDPHIEGEHVGHYPSCTLSAAIAKAEGRAS